MEWWAELDEMQAGGEYGSLIAAVRERVLADPRATLSNEAVKRWLRRRWRDLFLTEAVNDEAALRAAHRSIGTAVSDLEIPLPDDRPVRQRIAERFLLDDLRGAWSEEMPPGPEGQLETTFLLTPGLFNDMLPVGAFQDEFPVIEERFGMRTLRADCHPMRRCEENIHDIFAAIDEGRGFDAGNRVIPEKDARPPGDFFVIGYSKGMPDILTFLSQHPEVASRVRCIISWAGAVGGSYLADDIYHRVRDLTIERGSLGAAAKAVVKAFGPFGHIDENTRRLNEYDIKGAIRDLTTVRRRRFLERHAERLDELDVPIFEFTARTAPSEVPYFQVQGVLQINRHDRYNDMQVTREQARFPSPMATELAGLHGHHWEISYGPFPQWAKFGSAHLNNPFPRLAALVANVQLMTEIGLVD